MVVMQVSAALSLGSKGERPTLVHQKRGRATMWLHVRAPFAAFRWFQAGVYRATHPVMPPSSAYGLFLNLAAIDMRDAVAGPTTLIRSDVPLLRMAIGVVTPAERCSLYTLNGHRLHF